MAIPFVILALVFVGSLCAVTGRRASKNWQETTGTVIYSGVEERRSHVVGAAPAHPYYPKVVYEYQVMGQRFQGNQLRFGGEVGLGFYGMVERRINESILSAGRFPSSTILRCLSNPFWSAKLLGTRPILIGVAVLIVVILVITLIPTLLSGRSHKCFHNLVDNPEPTQLSFLLLYSVDRKKSSRMDF